MQCTMLYHMILLTIVLISQSGYVNTGAPVIHIGSFYTVAEDQLVNSTLFNFTADDTIQNHILSVEGTSEITNTYVKFDVNGSNPITVFVKLIHQLDRETLSKITLAFTVKDNFDNVVPKTVDLYVQDINDNSPIFQGTPYRWELPELPYNTSIDIVYNHITATDLDSGADVKYTLEPNAQSESTRDEYNKTFKIDERSGRVTLLKKLDYSANSYYQFTVTAYDRDGPNSTTDLIIRVTDVQNRPPFFTGVPYRYHMKENEPIGKSVLRVTARDGDTGIPNLVNYTILAGECSSLFNISDDGLIRTTQNIDRDSPDSLSNGACVLQVMAQEIDGHAANQHGDTNATTEVTITVIDCNDNAPKFGNSTYSAEIQENAAFNLPITLISPLEITLADADSEREYTTIELTLEYLNGTPCHDFSIVPSTVYKYGSVILRVNNTDILDYETIQNITILIVAQETNNTNHTDTATVTIDLLDVNDNNPQFTNTSYTLCVMENESNQSAGYITATDDDSDDGGTIAYFLSGGNKRFKVDRQNGSITTNCTNCIEELDREKVDVYYLTFTATDMNGTTGGRSNSVSVTVHVLDENDNTPLFIRNSPVRVYVYENDHQYKDRALVELEARDDDKSNTNNSAIWYKISSVSQPAAESNITVNETNGHLHLIDPIDFEKLNGSGNTRTINVIVIASDMGEPMLSSNITVLIEVQDVNDNIPYFNQTMLYGSVYENETSTRLSDAVVGQVFAEDDDGSDRNSAVNYYIVSGSSDDFRINSTSGEVSVQFNAKLDRETTPSYNLTILAMDQGSPPRSSTTTMTVNVLDVNDAIPSFNQTTYAHYLIENTTETINASLIVCPASDDDLNSDLSYNISRISARDENGHVVDNPSVESYFRIDENGTVFVNSITDRETAESIELELLVKDLNADIPLIQTSTAVLMITLLDINDNIPMFEETNYTMTVSENARNNTKLDSVLATDRDKNRTITYSLTAGPIPTASFTIHSQTGTISKNGYIDRERNTSVDLNVVAVDNGVPQLNSSILVHVIIIDFNDNAPVFLNDETNVTVEENCTIGTIVILMNATDDDEGTNAKIRFSINSSPLEAFEISATDGLVVVSGSIDREQFTEYTLQIIAKDQPENGNEQKSSMKTIRVIVQDINDNSPKFVEQYKHTIIETAEIGETVLTVHADDNDDKETLNAVVSYKFLTDTNPTGLFAINESTGTVTVNRSLKGMSNLYVIEVLAEDHGSPSLNGTTTINITVQDVNLNSPYITNPPASNTIKVYEVLLYDHLHSLQCREPNTKLYEFEYNDADKGENANAYFNISQIQDDVSGFRLAANGSLVLVQPLNFTVKSVYQFQVYVTDRGIPALSSDKLTLTLKVIDVDDHLPSFQSHTESLSVEENKPNGSFIGAVTAVDPDTNSISCYDIVGGDGSNQFEIDLHNGGIFTKQSFDREETDHIHFNVSVKDCSITNDTCANDTKTNTNVIDNIRVNVTVLDVDDNPPKFINAQIVTGMRRTTDVGSVIELNLKDAQYVTDNDTDKYGIHEWRFENNGTIQSSPGLAIVPFSGTDLCQDSQKHLFCISGNGSITSNRYFSEDLSGYFDVPVSVSDSCGSDKANVRIYLIGDSQVLIMVILGAKESVSKIKDEVLSRYSDITNHWFVYDGIADHKTQGGQIDPLKTDLYFHVVEPGTQRILSAAEAIRLIDQYSLELQSAMREFSVIEVMSSVLERQDDDNKARTIYILAAVVAALAVTMIIIIYVAITTKTKYQKKLKAALIPSADSKGMSLVAENPLFVPGSNQYSKQSNPLLNSEIPPAADPLYDNTSISSSNSLDENEVGEVREPQSDSLYDTMEEHEVTMDMFTEDSQTTGPIESPLDTALRLHSMQSTDKEVPEHGDNQYSDTETGPEFVTVTGTDNEAYIGDLESTEI